MERSSFFHWFLWWSWLLWAPRCVISQPGRDCLMLCSQNITCALECAACDFDCCSSTCDSAHAGDLCDPFCYGSTLNVSSCCVSPPSPPPLPAPSPGNCSVVDILAVNVTMVEGVPFNFNIVTIDSSCSGATCSCTTPYVGPTSLFQVRIFDSGTGFSPPKTVCNVSDGSSTGVFPVTCLAQNSIADANTQYILFVTLLSYGSWVVPTGFISPALTIVSGPVYIPSCVATWSNGSNVFVAGTMATLNITQKDAFNNTVSGKTGRSVLDSFQLAIIANPAVNTTSFQSFNVTGYPNEGLQTVSFYPTTAGRFYLQVGNGTHVIQKSPFRFNVVAAALSMSDSSAVWPNGINSFEAGSTAALAILQLDRFGNPISNPQLMLNFVYLEDNTIVSMNVSMSPLEIDNDYIAASFVPVQAGQYSLHVGNGTRELQLSPFTFSVVASSVAVEKCTGQWTGFKSTFVAGEKAEFNVLQMDAYGNNVSLATGSLSFYDFTVNLSVSDGSPFVISNLNLLSPELGSAFRTIMFFPVVSGTYFLNVGSDTANISKSPFLFRVLPGPISIPVCMGIWPNGSQFEAGVNGSLQIFKRDKYNNSVYDPYVFLATIVSLSSDIPVGSLPDLGVQVQNVNGTDYNLMTFLSTLSGAFECEVGSSTDSVSNSPLGFFVNASSVSTPACLPSWPKGVNKFPAGSEARLDILLKDVHNNTVSSVTGGYDFGYQLLAAFESANGSQLLQGYNMTFGDIPDAGIKFFKFYPTLAGTYLLSMWSSTANITGSPFLFSVTAGSISVWNCTASWLGGINTFEVGTQAVIQILLMDAYGNNVSLATGRNDSYNFVVEVQGYPDAINNWNVTVIPQNFSGYQSVVFFPIDAGDFKLRIGSKSKNISGSPFALTVTPGSLSVPDCSGDWLNGIEFYLQNSTVTFLLYPKDMYGNSISSNGLTVANFTALVYFASNLSMLGVPGMNVIQSDNYTLQFTFNMTQVGRFILQIGNASEDISGSPYLFTVTTDNVDPSRTIIDGAGLKNSTAGVQSAFLVQLRDSAGNPASANSSTMSVQFLRFGVAVNLTANISVVPKSSGAFVVSYVAILAGDYRIVVRWKGIILGGGPGIKKSVLPASIYGPWCTASYSSFSQSEEAGTTTVFVVTTVDAYNNTMPTGPVNITTKFFPTASGATTVTNNGDGTYTVTCNITTSGFYSVYIFAGSSSSSSPIRGSPFRITVSSGSISISNCRGAFKGGNVISEGHPVRFFVTLRDRFKNRVYRTLNETIFKMFTASVYAAAGNGPIPVSDMVVQQLATFTIPGDQILVAFIMDQIGDYKLVVGNATTKINAGAPYYFSIVQEAPSLLTSSFNGSGITDSTAGDVSTISITLKTQFGTAVVTDPNLLVVNVTLVESFSLLADIFADDASHGMYISNYTAQVAGDYTVSISWSKDLLVSYNKTVFPGHALPDACVASGNGLTGGVAGQILQFNISSYDQYGNPSARGSISFSIRFDPNFANLTTSWDEGGRFSASYSITVARKYNMSLVAVASGVLVPLRGSPFLITIKPAPLETNMSYITGEGLSSLASVVKWNEVVVFLTDIYENVVSVDTSKLNLTVQGPGVCTYQSFTEIAPGKYSGQYKPTAQGTYAASVFYANQILPESPISVTVATAPETAKDFTASIQPNDDVVAGDEVEIVVSATYKTNKSMIFMVELVSAVYSIALWTEKDNNSFFRAKYNATLAGSFNVEITLYNSRISGAYSLLVTPRAIYVPECEVSNSVILGTAIVGVPRKVIVQGKDRFGNNAIDEFDEEGVSVNFTMALYGPSMKEFVLDYTSQGKYVGSFVADKVGEYDLSILADFVDIKDSPFTVSVISKP